jgi:putative ABC transport system ATP-binding protein
VSTMTVESLTKTYVPRFGGMPVAALSDVNFCVEDGEFVGVMGPSGAGKTTLLNIIATIDTPTSGSVTIGDDVITALREPGLSTFRREHLGFIFQDFNLLDTLTLRENIALPLVLSHVSARNVDQRVDAAAESLGIHQLLEKYPYEVSGGERQRAAAARAIVGDPRLVLADEPTGALDSRSSGELLQRLGDLNKSAGTTIMLVTHDPFAASYCQRILFIKDGHLSQEIRRTDGRRSFYDHILEVLATFGGDSHDIH